MATETDDFSNINNIHKDYFSPCKSVYISKSQKLAAKKNSDILLEKELFNLKFSNEHT